MSQILLQLSHAIAEWVLNDPYLVSAFAKSRSGDALTDDNVYAIRNVNKRNSELLNSLLGLPKNILRSGRK